MKNLVIMGLVIASQPVAAAPQAPIAAGPVDSIFEALKAAKSCHVDQIRVTLYPADKDEAGLFLLQDPQDAAVKCMNRWLTVNRRRLRIKPRWWNDDFTKDQP